MLLKESFKVSLADGMPAYQTLIKTVE